MGIQFCEWKSSRSDGAVLGLKVASIEHGKRAHREKFFTPGDGILEGHGSFLFAILEWPSQFWTNYKVNNVTLATGTLRHGSYNYKVVIISLQYFSMAICMQNFDLQADLTVSGYYWLICLCLLWRPHLDFYHFASQGASSRNEFVQKAFKEPSLVLRVVTQDVIQEIESLESRLVVFFTVPAHS